MEVTIRYANKGDYDGFNELYLRCVLLEGTGNPTNYKPYGEKAFKNECSSNIIVAEKSGKIVGYTILDVAGEPNVIHLSEMFTDSSMRRTGVGRKMLEFLENEMKGSPYNEIELMSFSGTTDRIWERMGFKSKNFSECYRKKVS